MSDAGDSLDFRGRFLKLFGYAVIALAVGVVAWGVIELGGQLFGQAKHLRCQANLRAIAEALTIYRSTYGEALPPYLALLTTAVDAPPAKFICPADPDQGRKGCRPAWLRRGDGNIFANVDLDGPSLDPEHAADRFPCSYLYAANGYPCAIPDVEPTWREEFDRLVRQYGKGVPMVRCYYHLPEKYAADPQDPAARFPALDIGPTFNITADLRVVEYQHDWQSDPTFKVSH